MDVWGVNGCLRKTEHKPAVLALVAVVLVNGAGPATSTRVREIPAHRAFEEALAALTRELAVVLA